MVKTKADEFDQIAREVFAPIYPVIAAQILEATGIGQGTCLDIGCGGGYLGLALAQKSELEVILFDEQAEMLAIAQRNIDAAGLESRVRTLRGNVQAIPLADGSVDLAVSRGSIYFWEDQPQALREIYRVLAPGGCSYIGGGFGSSELKRQIDIEMTSRDPEWPVKLGQRQARNNPDRYREIMRQAEITDYQLLQADAGLWIMISKAKP